MSFNISHCVPTAHAGKNGSAFSTDILCLTAQNKNIQLRPSLRGRNNRHCEGIYLKTNKKKWRSKTLFFYAIG
jgi:hypothetical protein